MRWRCMYVHRIGHPLSSWKYSSNSLVALLEVKSASIGALCLTPTLQIQMVDLTDHSSGCMWGLKGSTAPPSRGIAQGSVHQGVMGPSIHSGGAITKPVRRPCLSWSHNHHEDDMAMSIYLMVSLPFFLPGWRMSIHSSWWWRHQEAIQEVWVSGLVRSNPSKRIGRHSGWDFHGLAFISLSTSFASQ